MIPYTVRKGDTLNLIAQRELGDANRWQEIADSNGLRYPFITDDVLEGTVRFGEVIYIPDIIEETERELDSGDLMDSDLLLEYNKFAISYANNGDLSEDEYGDLKTISGMRCLMQDLVNRLATPLGTLPYHPDYGSNINSIIGNKMDRDWVDKAIIEVTRTYDTDDRIVDVRDVSVEASRSTIKIKSTLVTVYGVQDFSVTTRG